MAVKQQLDLFHCVAVKQQLDLFHCVAVKQQLDLFHCGCEAAAGPVSLCPGPAREIFTVDIASATLGHVCSSLV